MATANETLLANLGLFRFFVKRAVRQLGLDSEELFQEAVVTFLREFPTFDGVHLSTFVRWKVGSAATRLVRDRKQALGERSLDAAEEPQYATSEPGPVETVEKAELLERLPAAVAALPEKSRELLARVYGLGGEERVTQQEIATAANLSHQAVSASVQAVCRRLRHMIDTRECEPEEPVARPRSRTLSLATGRPGVYMTRKQANVLDLIRAGLERDGRAPTIRGCAGRWDFGT